MKSIKIDGKGIGNGHPTFIVAEAGLNHNGDLKIAKKLIEEAHNSGADAIKFQTYKTENFLTHDSEYFKFFKSVELSFNDFKELICFSKQIGITFLSTPFDFESVNFLKENNVACFKVASSDINNIPILRKIAQTKIPTILSTGLSTIQEINDAIDIFKTEKNEKIILLHSVSTYPTSPEEVNMVVIQDLKNDFPYPIGYSDNGSTDLVDLVAASLGANLIERHFTLDKKMKGPDHFFSIQPMELKKLVSDIRLVEKIRGKNLKTPQLLELKNKNIIRKSIFAKYDIQIGETISIDNIGIKRPAIGIEPKFFDSMIGKKCNKKILVDTAIQWEDLE
jgi:N,N'-diacetyllegionaminate synthase